MSQPTNPTNTQTLNVLITSGNTVEQIDSVRCIANSSSGALGALIADALGQHNITYVSNNKAIKPKTKYRHIETKGVLDVEAKLKQLLTTEKFDIVIHSMAISDYYIDTVTMNDNVYTPNDLMRTKVSSDAESMDIHLRKAPKIIQSIKKWQPHTYLVGFKLLNNVTEDHLFDVAFTNLRKNRANLVIANDLTTVKAGNHTALFVYPEKTVERVESKQSIASHLADVLTYRAKCKYPRSNQEQPVANIPDTTLTAMKQTGATLFKESLLPTVEGGTYGNLSMRSNTGFIITGRNVHKGKLTKDIVCHIKNVQPVNDASSTYADIFYDGTVKPSIDTAIHAAIYEKNPQINAILHTHTNNVYARPITNYNYPCGSYEEKSEIVAHIDAKNHQNIVQMFKHGLIMTGATLDDCLTQLHDVQKEAHLTPLDVTNTTHHALWLEWCKHYEIVTKAENKIDSRYTKPENFMVFVNESNNVQAIVYLQINTSTIQFMIYTPEHLQKRGLRIGAKILNILKTIRNSRDLVLVTHNNCNVIDYYKKQNFKNISNVIDYNDGLVYMQYMV